MIDVGCGAGCQTRFARSIGIEAVAVDGDFVIGKEVNDVVIHDYVTGPLIFNPSRQFDLGWSTEFVEHVEEKFLPNFMHTFRLCDNVLITYVPPERPGGHHHVNKRRADYWIGAFMENGFVFDWVVTRKIREKSTMAKVPWMREFGLFFRKV